LREVVVAAVNDVVAALGAGDGGIDEIVLGFIEEVIESDLWPEERK